MKRSRAALSSAAVFLFCMTVAQMSLIAEDANVTPLYRQSQASELRAPLDSIDLATFPEPKGLRFGQLRISPYLTYDTTYSDNSTRSKEHKVEDILQDSAEGFAAIFHPHECVTYTLNYEFGWHDYLRGTERNYMSHAAGFTATLNRVFVEGLSLSFSDQYFQSANSSILENEIIQFTRYESDRAAMRAQYKFNRFKVSGEYAYSLTKYFSRPNNASNFRTHTGDLEAAWEWLPRRLELFEDFQLQRTLFDHDGKSDFDSYTIRAGARGSYLRLSYSVSAGYAFAVPVYENGVRGDGSFAASIGYEPHRRLAFDLQASRAFQAGVRTGAALETDLTTSAKILLTSRGKLIFSYTRNQSDRQSGITQISVAYSTRFDYKLSRMASMGMNFTRYERTETANRGDFAADEAKLSFKLAW